MRDSLRVVLFRLPETLSRRRLTPEELSALLDRTHTPSDQRSIELIRQDAELHCEWMVDAGCDLLLIETMNSVAEAEVCLGVARSLDVPAIVSLVTDRTGRHLLDGSDLSHVTNLLLDYRPEAILTNCASPRATLVAVRTLSEVIGRNGIETGYGGYPNSGDPDPVLGWDHVREVSSEEFSTIMGQILDEGAQYVGSCCGTTPVHTASIAALLDSRRPGQR